MDVNMVQNFYHVPKRPDAHCLIVNVTAEHSVGQSDNPFTQALPLLVTQIATAMLITHSLFFILRPFYIPRIVVYILGGLLLSPSAMANTNFFATTFPLKGVILVETVANWALSCHMFLLGLEMDVAAILRTEKKAINVALAAVSIPFVIGIGLFFILSSGSDNSNKITGCFFYAGALAVTGFPVVSRILTDTRLFHSEIGRMAVSVSVVNDLLSWILLAALISMRTSSLNILFAIVSTVGFTVFCFLIVRPAIAWIINRTSKANKFDDHYLSFVIVMVSLFACFSDILGTNSIVGAFVFGLIMPNRILATILLDKFEEFISGYLLPLFFIACTHRINIWDIQRWSTAIIVIILASGAKIVAAYLVSFFINIRPRECFALGVFLNTKGVLAVIMLNAGFDSSFLNHEEYAVMMLAILIMTGATAPIIATMYRPAKRLSRYKRRTIQKARHDAEFRIMTCFYDVRTIFGMIHLLDISNATKESPLCVFALHLMELTGRGSAMLIVHNSNRKPSSRDPQAEKIITALETYANLNEHVTIQLMTALTPVATMHEDICSLSEEKHIGFVILPFHKPPTTDDAILEEDGRTAYRGVNLNVLPNAPCTVGIFMDRGFGANQGDSNLRMKQIAMLFIGGPDDREALAFSWRMAGSHGVGLTVVRFIAGDRVEEIEPNSFPGGQEKSILSSASYVDRQRVFDDEYVNEFRLKSAEEELTRYKERLVNDDEDTVEAIKEMSESFDLFVVGKGEGMVTPITAGLLDWCEFPELGAIGDLLVTSTFVRGSVLVMQQYEGPGDGESDDDRIGTPEVLRSWARKEKDEEEDGEEEVDPFAR